jgi:hypothetical protein
MSTAQTIAPHSQPLTPLTRAATGVLVIVLAAAVGLGAYFAIDQLRGAGPGAPTSSADAFSTQRYAELSAPQDFSTQDYTTQHD